MYEPLDVEAAHEIDQRATYPPKPDHRRRLAD